MTGRLAAGLEPKDIILAIIRAIGTGGGTGHVIEYYGPAISALSMEGRMTVCNMSIEAGARAGLIAPDDTTFEYITRGDRPFAPKGTALEAALADWKTLAHRRPLGLRPPRHDRRLEARAAGHLGHEPGDDRRRDRPGSRPRPRPVRQPRGRPPGPRLHGPDARHADRPRSPSTSSSSARAPTAGSRTCGPRPRSSRAARSPRASGPWSSPAARQVRHQAEAEGLDRIFTEAGAEWRQAGCSMCLAMNPDKLTPGQRSASTSNRNFEGRQGPGGRTHLVSPAMAAAAAVTGHFTDVRSCSTEASRTDAVSTPIRTRIPTQPLTRWNRS